MMDAQLLAGGGIIVDRRHRADRCYRLFCLVVILLLWYNNIQNIGLVVGCHVRKSGCGSWQVLIQLSQRAIGDVSHVW